MIRWQYFPRSTGPTACLRQVAAIFEQRLDAIDSSKYTLTSNQVLDLVRPGLVRLGFKVEVRKSRIPMPVLYGPEGKPDKTFYVDAWNETEGTVIEVEAGRAVVNHQFLKDIFESAVIDKVSHLGIAVRNKYGRNDDFKSVSTFLDTLYSSNRLQLNLEGIMVIGY